MASGYVTADGKDLDSRYLGINSKAASAKVADSANSISGSAVYNKLGVTGGTRINVNSKSTNTTGQSISYTTTADGYVNLTCAITGYSSNVNGWGLTLKVGGATRATLEGTASSKTVSTTLTEFLKKGTAIQLSCDRSNTKDLSISGSVCPISLYAKQED